MLSETIFNSFEMFLKIVRVVKLWKYFPFEPIVMSAKICPWFSVDQLLMMLELCLRIPLRSSTTMKVTTALLALRLSNRAALDVMGIYPKRVFIAQDFRLFDPTSLMVVAFQDLWLSVLHSHMISKVF